MVKPYGSGASQELQAILDFSCLLDILHCTTIQLEQNCCCIFLSFDFMLAISFQCYTTFRNQRHCHDPVYTANTKVCFSNQESRNQSKEPCACLPVSSKHTKLRPQDNEPLVKPLLNDVHARCRYVCLSHAQLPLLHYLILVLKNND